MVYSAIISTVVLMMVLLEIYYLGKYVSIKQELFVNNKFSAFVIGFITYFVISFAVFFIFIFFKVGIIYFVIFFVIKDVIQIMYLLARRDVFVGSKIKPIDIAITVVVAVAIVFIFNYVTPYFETLRFRSNFANFQSWYKFQEIVSKITVIDIKFIYKWFGATLVSFFGYASVMSFINNFTKKDYWWVYIFGFIITLAMFFGFTFNLEMESGAGPFFILFAILSGINIITYSRRRYASIFGIVVIAAWSFNPDLFLVLLVIAFSTLVIYTILQKPKVSLFWVQLMAPLAIVSTFWINDFSRPLGLSIMLIAIFAYVFMLSIGRVNMLDKLNNFFLKMRYIIPAIILATIIIAATVLGLVEGDRDSQYIVKNTTYLFDVHSNDILGYIQIGIYSLLIAFFVSYFVYIIVYKKKLLRNRLTVMLATFVIVFALNPAFWLVIANTILEQQFRYLSLAILPPLIIVAGTKLPSIWSNKKIVYA